MLGIKEVLNKGKFKFDGLFIFDLANNHQGNVEHGKRIIREVAAVAKKIGMRAACKLQFRDLDTFIHPYFKENLDNKHIPRFLSTKLTDAEFAELVAEIKNQGLISMATPFDEASVDLLIKLNVDILKIASCSAKDWPLLEIAAAAGKPIVASTAGLTIEEIDNLVSFLDHRTVPFAIMHCVAIYPTPTDQLHLHQIELLKERYPKVPIGFSTHEDQNDFSIIKMAYAKGTRIFERHVGVPTNDIKLNAYSSTPEQIEKWLIAYQEAVAASGSNHYSIPSLIEQDSLRSLMRGIYAKQEIKKGQTINRPDVFFAMPLQPGQLTSGEWQPGLIADRDYSQDQILPQTLLAPTQSKKQIIAQVIHEVKALLNLARIELGHEFNIELSHHYGVKNFKKVGIVMIDMINREYCKKILIQLPGQIHPYHHHQKKEEMFQLLYGRLIVEIEGRKRLLYPGDKLLIQRGMRHSFWTEDGAIFEEISTTHFTDDSFYDDPEVRKLSLEERKTKLINWGRHQF
ncbi:MAG: sialic acid synthase [Candidatus Buchananbacteria bacterium RIFCSPHIGHO2_01_FULL_39_14]|uniref:Sialic acid synthase n=1 Tax=Candidatus Buchananbacteria bacterium RIFCSPHIGHO2_01_FULL_39_14 TaxID=1797532 RepID=A0A1G1XU27_9BACT|nr:MAG: sialic acid synthase [Candidatus Buchananbacteria bacterium RIFCSPHIGHO2_01_FULL_39_14]